MSENDELCDVCEKVHPEGNYAVCFACAESDSERHSEERSALYRAEKQAAKLLARAEKAEAERDEARALAIGAYEDDSGLPWWGTWTDEHNGKLPLWVGTNGERWPQ